MSSDVAGAEPPAGSVRTERTVRGRTAERGSPRRTRRRTRRWWLGGHRRLHRWGSLVLGVPLLIQTTTGAVLLFEREINQALHPALYRETTGAGATTPLSAATALRRATAEHPELPVTSVRRSGGVWVAAGPEDTGLATYLDAGSGRVNGVGPVSPRAVRLLANLHECGFTCRGYPGYQPWLATSLPSALGGQTAGGWLLGLLGVLTVVLAVSGAALWWPGARRLAGTLRVRWRRGGYGRHRDLHRTVGVLALPFLFMWGWTGAAFSFQWPQQAYFAVLPGHARADPPPTVPGTGPPLTVEQAEDVALRLHPGAEVTGLGLPTAGAGPGGYLLRLRSGPDPYAYSDFPGNHAVAVDRRGGGVIDYAPEPPGRPVTERWWSDGVYNGVHFGTVVPGLPRLVWLVFGLSPLLLGVTGTVLWLTGRRGARTRRRARRAAAAPPRPPVRGRPPTRPSPGGG